MDNGEQWRTAADGNALDNAVAACAKTIATTDAYPPLRAAGGTQQCRKTELHTNARATAIRITWTFPSAT